MKRIPADKLDPDGVASEFWTRKGKPVTGVVVGESDGRVLGEWYCRDGLRWGPQRRWNPLGAPFDAYFCLAGHIHGFRRLWAAYGRKRAIEEYRFGIQVRRRTWEFDGFVETSPALEELPDAAYYEGIIESNRRSILKLGGDPSEVPALFSTLRPGEWDDPATPNDVANWLALDPQP